MALWISAVIDCTDGVQPVSNRLSIGKSDGNMGCDFVSVSNWA